MKQPYIWDNYSDQPYPLRDKRYKKEMRKSQLSSLFKTFFVSLFILPFSILIMPFIKKNRVDSNSFFCIGVDYQRESEATLEFIEELGVDRVLVRFKLWEMNTIYELKSFLSRLKEKKITLKIIQDREHIEDLDLLREDLENIFSTLNQDVDIFEIGTTINRTKWGFFSVEEYNRFYKIAYDLKKLKFPHIKLIGSGVIDFEYHFTAHTLFNFYDYKYDGVSSLLYVDRRGAPENMQMGFTLIDKIILLSSMVWLSPKSVYELHITETNWPILGTAPYAPTSEYECVSEELYGDYMLRYYLLAFASQQVNSVSWHQLIASGYGLIDSREGLRKRDAYEIYKHMVQILKNAKFLSLDIKKGYFIFKCFINEDLLEIHWSLESKIIKNEDNFRTFSSSGKKIDDEFLNVGSSPLYIFIK